jgi:hypothetical protein
MQVYIGAAVDSSDKAVQVFGTLTSVLKKVVEEATIYNPYAAFSGGVDFSRSSVRYICDVNNYALDRADLAVFYVCDTPSIGVPYEIARRAEYNKPLIVWYEATKKAGVYLHNFAYDQIVYSQQQLEEALSKFAQAKIKKG